MNFLKEQYNLIKDKLVLSSEAHLLHKPCHSCHKNSHTVLHCPLLNLKINRSHLIHKYNSSVPQNRCHFNRKDNHMNAKMIFNYAQNFDGLPPCKHS